MTVTYHTALANVDEHAVQYQWQEQTSTAGAGREENMQKGRLEEILTKEAEMDQAMKNGGL